MKIWHNPDGEPISAYLFLIRLIRRLFDTSKWIFTKPFSGRRLVQCVFVLGQVCNMSIWVNRSLLRIFFSMLSRDEIAFDNLSTRGTEAHESIARSFRDESLPWRPSSCGWCISAARLAGTEDVSSFTLSQFSSMARSTSGSLLALYNVNSSSGSPSQIEHDTLEHIAQITAIQTIFNGFEVGRISHIISAICTENTSSLLHWFRMN